MKLFNFDIIKLPEENAILVTRNGYLYYVYNPTTKSWYKYSNAGNDLISVNNYQDVTRDELASSFDGVFPEKQTAFLKACSSYDWNVADISNLLSDEFPFYMKKEQIKYAVDCFLSNSLVLSVSYERLGGLFEDAEKNSLATDAVLSRIKQLSFSILGKDIFNDNIEIVDGLRGSSFFHIMPSRIIAPASNDYAEIPANMTHCGISIEDDDVYDFLSCFLYKHFDEELDANKNRCNADGFDWYNDNYFTLDSIGEIIADIRDTADKISTGSCNEFTDKVRTGKNGKEKVLDFYRRFIYRMEYMVVVGRENGFNLISFTGP